MANTPAGWYPQADGRQRYWDGEKWTEHLAPGSQQAAATTGGGAFAGAGTGAVAVPGGSATRPWFKKKRFIIPGGLVGLIILGSALSGGGEDPASAAAAVEPTTSTSATTPADTPSKAPAPAPSTTPSPVAKVDNTPKYGSKVRDGKFEFVVTGMKCGIKTVGSEYFNTKAQGEFCRVSMKITNIGDEAQSMFADNQLAFDAKEREFSADSEASIYDDKSNVLFEEINPGNTVSGRVYFDVPKGTKLVRMELHDSMFSGGVEVALKK